MRDCWIQDPPKWYQEEQVPRGGYLGQQDLELFVGAGFVAAPANPTDGSPGKVTGLPGATRCCRTSPLMPNEFIMNNVIVIDTAQGLFLILNND